jgi:hypothetical protein
VKNQEGLVESLAHIESLNKNLLGLVGAESFLIWIMSGFSKNQKVYRDWREQISNLGRLAQSSKLRAYSL